MTELDAKTKQQIKVYSKWVSNKLKNVETCKVNDITTDLADGTALIELAEILTKKAADPAFKKPAKFPFQEVQKCDHAIQMFKNNGISLGNSICGKDIHDKNIQQILYLVWMLILNYSIDPAVREDENFRFSKENTNTDSKNIANRNKIQLLTWATDKIKDYSNIQDKFKPYDLAINALVHKYYPNEIDYEALDKDDHDTNLEIANKAMEKLQIPVFITPEDFKSYDYKVDEDCLMTQLSALKGCLDKKYPKRQSLVGRQNNPFARSKKVETKSENIQTDPIHHQKPRNGKPPALSSHKKVIINESCAIFPDVNEEKQSDPIDLKKAKATSKSASVFPIRPESQNKRVRTNFTNTDINTSPTKNRNMKLDSRDIYSQSDKKDIQNMQIESTNFEINPEPSNKPEENQSINSNNTKKVETRDFGIQPDSDLNHVQTQISPNNSGVGQSKKAQNTTRDFGVQPDSENSEKKKYINDNNQIQVRDINLDISIESDGSSNEKIQNNSKDKEKKNNIEIQTDLTSHNTKKTRTTNLEIGGLEEKQVFTLDSDSNSNHKKNQSQVKNTETQSHTDDKPINSNDQEISSPIIRKRKSDIKNPQRKHSKFHMKRRNTYFGSIPTKDFIDDDLSPQLNSDDNIIEEEEEINDKKDNHKNKVVSPKISQPENNRQVQTRSIQFGMDEEEEDNSKENPSNTSKITKKNSNHLVTHSDDDKNKNEDDENNKNESEDQNEEYKNKNENEYDENNKNENEDQNEEFKNKNENEDYESNENENEDQNEEYKNKNKNEDYENNKNESEDDENNENENEDQNDENKNKDENDNKEEEDEIQSVNSENGHQRNHRKHSGTKHTKHRHKRIHSKRSNTHTTTTTRHSNLENEEDEEERTEEEIENIPKTKDNETDSDEIISKKRQSKPTSSKKRITQKRSIQSRNFDIGSANEEEEEDSFEKKNNRKIRSRPNKINVHTDKSNLLETRDVGVQSPKGHRSRQFNTTDSLNENSDSLSTPKTLRIKVNGNIDRSIVITVRNFSHHSRRNESAHSSRRHAQSTLNSPKHNSPSSYRSHTPHHRTHSHFSSNPTSYSVPNTPKYKKQDSRKECSIIPVINDDGNKTPNRKFKVHVKDQDLQVKKKFSDSVSGIKITFNESQDNNSLKDEQNIES